MKKLLFTAIALVAFSGVSMANNIEESTVETIETFLVVGEDCAELANQLIETIENEEGALSADEEDYYWYSSYSYCMNN